MAKTVSQKGRKMSDNTLVKIALNKVMALCASREYCSEDIRIKLDSWGVKVPDAINIINKLTKENFINDKRYSEAFVKDKYHHNKWGKVKIASHLKAKNISSELIESALASLDNDHYKQTIKDILVSHRKFIKAKNQYDLKGKLLRYGLSKGFESNILYDILNEPDQ
jgi:regulatory protein